jgi:hypothetical protein
MTIGQPQAEPQDRLSKCFKAASFRDRRLRHGRSPETNFRAARDNPIITSVAGAIPEPVTSALMLVGLADLRSRRTEAFVILVDVGAEAPAG